MKRKKNQKRLAKKKNKARKQNQEKRAEDNVQMRKIPTMTTLDHTLLKISTKVERGDEPRKEEIAKRRGEEEQNKFERNREQNKGSKNEKISMENEKYEGIIELNENQGEQLRKLIERKVNETGIKLEPTNMTKHKVDEQGHEPIKQR